MEYRAWPELPPESAGYTVLGHHKPPEPVDYIEPGTRLWFEYHCWESPASCDAEIWYRSHQQVDVLGLSSDCEDCRLQFELSSEDCEACAFQLTKGERGEAGVPLTYLVRFDDGFEYTAFEDELLESPTQFSRSDPPPRP